MAKIYIAARFTQQPEARAVRDILEKLGHTTTSGWVDEVDDDAMDAAQRDVADIKRADSLLLLTGITEGGKGMWAEFGMALALKKKVYVYPSLIHSCVFMHLPEVTLIGALGDIPV